MQYFSGRFTGDIDKLILDFHSSIHFDNRLYRYDIMGSIAHVRGLVKSKVISADEGQIIEKALFEILTEIDEGKIQLSTQYEDIHMNIEKSLIDKIGDTGKKLHTGRSRNDQVALDMKLYTKDEIKKIQSCLLELIDILSAIAQKHVKSYLPGFTHLQKAQPISLAHYMLAYVEMFKRDYLKLSNAYDMMNTSPLGSAALAGTTFPLDREYTSSILGFESPSANSLDGVSDRDYLLELFGVFSTIMVHLSRFCEEIIIYSSNDYNYFELSDSFSTGSSIMPQKKNPDAAELIRGKAGRVIGNMTGFFATMKGIPLAYNKDMQEDKEAFFDTVDTVKSCLTVFNGMISAMGFNVDVMRKACEDGFINATDLADYLTAKGMSFRDAYKTAGSIVLYGLKTGKSLSELTMDEYRQFADSIDDGIYQAISIENCVEKRRTTGSPSESCVTEHISQVGAFINKEKSDLVSYKLNDIL
ncbi:MAG: argininosuccinate lyase [Epulopiscium sp. Nele67-Bin004]|nr:MAG: argininosuccinate lyase [Epulopiscium sp. Nele67-Bin004]